MANLLLKHIGPSKKYKHVYEMLHRKKGVQWQAKFSLPEKKIDTSKIYSTEREAALAIDHFFIRHGKEPVNILKRK